MTNSKKWQIPMKAKLQTPITPFLAPSCSFEQVSKKKLTEPPEIDAETGATWPANFSANSTRTTN